MIGLYHCKGRALHGNIPQPSRMKLVFLFSLPHFLRNISKVLYLKVLLLKYIWNKKGKETTFELITCFYW